VKKRRSGPNPLAEYRRIQREIRAIFDPFTARHCPTCTTPCCIKPARVTPVDVALAEGHGHRFAHLGDADAYAPALVSAGERLSEAIALPVVNDSPAVPCDYLSAGRCSFPDDLRPFGCTTYICPPMYRHMEEDTLRSLRRLVRQLDDAHTALMRVVGADTEASS
jgi:hypothetical protein